MPCSSHPAVLFASMLAFSTPGAGETRLVIAHTWDGEPVGPDEQVTLHLRTGDGSEAIRLEIDAPFHGDPPPPGAARSLDGLWNYEVVELFIAAAAPGEDVAYTEIEVSPHGHYLVLRLAGARRVVEKGLALEVETRIEGRRWYAGATIPAALLPTPPWTANAYALHGAGAGRRYLAMIPVPGSSPDFHRPELFRRLELDSR